MIYICHLRHVLDTNIKLRFSEQCIAKPRKNKYAFKQLLKIYKLEAQNYSDNLFNDLPCPLSHYGCPASHQSRPVSRPAASGTRPSADIQTMIYDTIVIISKVYVFQ